MQYFTCPKCAVQFGVSGSGPHATVEIQKGMGVWKSACEYAQSDGRGVPTGCPHVRDILAKVMMSAPKDDD